MILQACNLGTLPYASALSLQRAAAAARIRGELSSDLLLLVEHPPVVTLGRTSRESHLVVSAEYLAAQGIELFEVERGGDVTFHGPGQLVGYPIIDLKGIRQDLHWYLRQVEESLIRTLATCGVAGGRNPGYTGVWVGTEGAPAPGGPEPASERPGPLVPVPASASQLEGRWQRKIASIGVHARDWVTWHGFALNVSTDLRHFDLMVPCGIPGVRMTSLEAELEQGVPMAGVRSAAALALAMTFGFSDLVWVDPEDLPASLHRTDP